ncbi:MAG TPA: efflux transporter outer membrane subunit [Burkholderiales bacterium]|nr:efflux transporter outer membrane subunit [Burkholderiales bacterium]
MRSGPARALALTLLLAGCALQPDYRRPPVELPSAWKQSAQNPERDGPWWRVFRDPALDALVAEALEHNTDLAQAVARVDQARALAAQVDAALYPQVDAGFTGGRQLYSTANGLLPPGINRELTNYRATVSVSYELDLWGKLRASSQAARADLLASEASRETVRLALAADVAKTWFGLRALDAQVASTRQSVALLEEGLALQRKRFEHGVISEFDYRQLEAEAATTRAQLPPLERDREILEAGLAVLAGRSPKAIMDETIASDAGQGDAALAPAVVPEGLPSELLLRRPDLVEAEQRLVAANARIAVARAQMFPSIPLTGYAGSEAQTLAALFTGPAGIWKIALGAAGTIFAAGRLGAQVDEARARERELLAAYQGAIQNAFREVRAALATQRRARESYDVESARATALEATLRLVRLRYANGLASQLEVLDANRNLLAAMNARHEALRAQRAAVADLYKALGG